MWNMCSKQAAEFAKGLSHTKRPRGPTREVMGASVHDTFSSRQSPYHRLEHEDLPLEEGPYRLPFHACESPPLLGGEGPAV